MKYNKTQKGLLFRQLVTDLKPAPERVNVDLEIKCIENGNLENFCLQNGDEKIFKKNEVARAYL